MTTTLLTADQFWSAQEAKLDALEETLNAYDAERLAIVEEANKKLEETNKRLRAALDECREWFADRHDADCQDGEWVPNEEMKMTATIDAAMGWSF